VAELIFMKFDMAEFYGKKEGPIFIQINNLDCFALRPIYKHFFRHAGHKSVSNEASNVSNNS
jgi:hypothetical protein